MSRPIRYDFPGAVFHITSRGDRREPVFLDEDDRHAFLAVLGQACERHGFSVLAYCLMGNHYHLVACSEYGELSRFMRTLNGQYSLQFNRRRRWVGHVFQGRFKAVLVDDAVYLAAVVRYVERNPVAAGRVPCPLSWRWSSVQHHLGTLAPWPWLDSQRVLAWMLGRAPHTTDEWAQARQQYRQHVSAPEADLALPPAWQEGFVLGRPAFVAQHLAAAQQAASLPAHRQTLQRKAKSIAEWMAEPGPLHERVWQAHVLSGHALASIARHLEISPSWASALLAKAVQARAQAGQGLLDGGPRA
ncbi:MAG: transposase [Burkholderiaceae bacterium]|nr:MAG: transposase [Burkholderiaceae bacterium]